MDRVTRSKSKQLRNGKILFTTEDLPPPRKPATKKPRAPEPPPLTLMDLPSDVLQMEILAQLDAESLVCCLQTSKDMRREASHEEIWQRLVTDRWGAAELMKRASARVGGYKKLYALKAQLDNDPSEYRECTEAESNGMIDLMLEAARSGPALDVIELQTELFSPPQPLSLAQRFELDLERESTPIFDGLIPSSPTQEYDFPSSPPTSSAAFSLAHGSPQAPSTPPGGRPIPVPSAPPVRSASVFLLDGSGSVSENEFSRALSFGSLAASALAQKDPLHMSALLQFACETKEEAPLLHRSPSAIEQAFQGVTRMNGGTNLDNAFKRARELLQSLPKDCPKIIVLLTDGRLDSHQVRNAEDLTSKLADLGGVHLFCVSVGTGRGTDESMAVLSKILDGPQGKTGASKLPVDSRFLPLLTRDVPW